MVSDTEQLGPRLRSNGSYFGQNFYVHASVLLLSSNFFLKIIIMVTDPHSIGWSRKRVPLLMPLKSISTSPYESSLLGLKWTYNWPDDDTWRKKCNYYYYYYFYFAMLGIQSSNSHSTHTLVPNLSHIWKTKRHVEIHVNFHQKGIKRV